MPDDLSQLDLQIRMALEAADPELFSLFKGTATAEVEAAALNNTLPDKPVALEKRQEASLKARIQELIAARPYGAKAGTDEQGRPVPAVLGNMTLALELERLDPQTAAQLKAAACPPKPVPGALTQEEANRINARLGHIVTSPIF